MSEYVGSSVNSDVAVDGTWDAVVVGAGFAGMYMLQKLRELGLRTIVIEAGDDVGGTWYWNRYPGARCDVPSRDYSYSFSDKIQQEWSWSEMFSAQPEILSYANFVADTLNLRRDIRFATKVTSASYDGASNRWALATDRGDRIEARYVIMATGCLSMPKIPDIAGLSTFGGEIYYTSTWPKEAPSFAGKRVGVVGTGSSGIQVIPVVAEQAGHLTVFQRTPSFTLPARNKRISAEETEEIKANYPALRAKARQSPNCGLRPITDRSSFSVSDAERTEIFEQVWENGGITFGATFGDLVTNEEANAFAADFARNKIGQIVRDPAIAEKLKPYDYPIGTRRICLDTGYYETFNRANVTLADCLEDPIDHIDATGVVTKNARYDLDVLIFATGFDAMTGALLAMDIQGRDGVALKDKWKDGPKALLGVGVSGFPNMFMITGPGSPSVLSNVIGSIEQHVEWISDCIAYLREKEIATIEPDSSAELEWVQHVNDVADKTLYMKANSWFVGANIPGKPRVFMPYVGGCHNFRAICDDVASNGYRGFSLGGTPDKRAAGAAREEEKSADIAIG